MKKSNEKSAAILTVKDAAKMTKMGRKQIAKWLRDRANDVEQHGDNLACRFTARYIYH